MNEYVRLLNYLRPYWRRVVLVILLALLSVIVQGLSVWVGAEFIGGLLSGHPSPVDTQAPPVLAMLDTLARRVLSQATPYRSLLCGVFVLIGVRFFLGALQVWRIVLLSRTSQSILATLRASLFDRLTLMDISFTRKVRPGEVASVFIRDVDQIHQALVDILETAVMHPARLLFVIVLMLAESWTLTIWLLAWLAIGGVAVHYSGNAIERACHTALETISKMQGGLVEYLSSCILARMSNREDFERRQFRGMSDAISHQLVRIIYLRNLSYEAVRCLFAVCGTGILIIGGYQVFVVHSLEASALLRMVLLLALGVSSAENLASLYGASRVSLASLKRVYAFLDLPVTIQGAPGLAIEGSLQCGITVRDVDFEDDGNRILTAVSFDVARNQRVVIVGPSGAGKSTVLALLAGVLCPTRGSIAIDGVDLRHISISSWRAGVGIVTQDPVLLNTTVRENLLYACPCADDARLIQVLRAAQFGTEEYALRLLLDRPVGNRGDLLSGGERQRIAIARAILPNPHVLLMDEPTSMLDASARQAVRDTILEASISRTLVLVTHDAALGEIADLELLMESGRVVDRRERKFRYGTDSCE